MRSTIDLDAVALIDPVSDAGIGVYTHELAQALVHAGADVAVYRRPAPLTGALPRAYQAYPIPGAVPTQTRPVRANAFGLDGLGGPPNVSALNAYFDVLARLDRDRASVRSIDVASESAVAHGAAELTVELLEEIASRGARTVWTQWPVADDDASALRDRCHAAGLSLLHTVHNVTPHEPDAVLNAAHETTHAAADGLIVHSEASRRALLRAVPNAAGRTYRAWHGLYTIYPDRSSTRARVRDRLGASARTTVVLVFGGVRPYKNVDAIVAAMREAPAHTIVVIAGWEWGYPDLVAGDRLGRIRRLVRAAGVDDRVRLLPGRFGVAQTAELFTAADVVAVPYTESFGSGVLLLAMTYGRHVLATPAGGMDEYLVDYPAHTLIADGSVDSVRRGLVDAAEAVQSAPRTDDVPERLRWSSIVAALRRDISMPSAHDVLAR